MSTICKGARLVGRHKQVYEGQEITNEVVEKPVLKKSVESDKQVKSCRPANLKSVKKANISEKPELKKENGIKMFVFEGKEVESDVSEENVESADEEKKAESLSELNGTIEKINNGAANGTVLVRNIEPKVDKAKQPTATLITVSRHGVSRNIRKLTKEVKAKQPTATLAKASKDVRSRKGRKVRCKSVKAYNRITATTASLARRSRTESCRSKSEKKVLQQQRNKNKELLRQRRRAYQENLDTQNAELRRRIKNVRSKLFSETRSFAAYKFARSRQMKEQNDKSCEMVRRSDRSVDFTKKSRRQRKVASI